MARTLKRCIILAVVVVVAYVLGHLAVRALLNLLVGGTMLGANYKKVNREMKKTLLKQETDKSIAK